MPDLRDCPSGKVPFGSKSKAERALGKHRALGGGARYVYRCHHCGEWHFTSKDRIKQRKPEPPVQIGRLAKPAAPQPWEPRPARTRHA